MKKDKNKKREDWLKDNSLEVTFRGKTTLGAFDLHRRATGYRISVDELLTKLKNKEISIKYDLLPDHALIDEVWEIENAELTYEINDEGDTTEIDLTPEDSWGE